LATNSAKTKVEKFRSLALEIEIKLYPKKKLLRIIDHLLFIKIKSNTDSVLIMDSIRLLTQPT
jgi:hypothetical protein